MWFNGASLALSCSRDPLERVGSRLHPGSRTRWGSTWGDRNRSELADVCTGTARNTEVQLRRRVHPRL